VTTESKSRIDRIKEAHPEARDVWIHGMLVAQYDRSCKDPTTRGPDGVQVQLENYTDLLVKMTPQAFLNEVARVSELYTYTWDQIELEMKLNNGS
jgi:hypothetical protein